MNSGKEPSTAARPTAVNKQLQALLTFFALLPLVYFIPPWVGNTIDNHLITTVISVALIVPLISYLIMPLLLKIMLK